MTKAKEKKIEVTSINFTLGRKEVSLTMDEAKKLKLLLDEMFGKEVVHHYDNNWWWHRPLIATNDITINPTGPYAIDSTALVDSKPSDYTVTSTNDGSNEVLINASPLNFGGLDDLHCKLTGVVHD